MSVQMNLNLHKAVPMLPNMGSRKRTYKRNIISCWAAESSTQGKRSDFYEVLSLGSKTVGLAEIKKAYRSKALQYHPDVCPDPSAKEESKQRFIELRKAYETLSNPTSRRIYDHELGLVNSLCYGSEAFVDDRIMTSFPREVWEKQLNGLKQRSNARMRMRKSKAYF